MQYFSSCTTLNEVKSLYKKLALENHPDRGGNEEVMKEVNNEYEFIVAKLAKGGNLTSEEINNAIEESEAYREAINAVINFPGIVLEVVGSWIWATGNTYTAKDTLKGAGFMWANKKKAWYFRTDENKSRNRSKMSLDEIRTKYGSKTLSGNNYGKNFIAA